MCYCITEQFNKVAVEKINLLLLNKYSKERNLLSSILQTISYISINYV